MKVTVFGATGGIGRLVVGQLLDSQHDVTVYVRDPVWLDRARPGLTVVVGELTDADAIDVAVSGADAVISALGPSLARGATGTPVADGTRRIVVAMEGAGVARYVGLATPSVPDPRDRPTLKGRVLRLAAATFLPNALLELEGMTDAVTGSDLDWTIARITRPTDGRARGTVRAGFLGVDRVGASMTRADIATFLVAQLDSATYSRALPAISN